MNLSKLHNEVDGDPLERGYASMSNSEIAVDMNTKYRTSQVVVNSRLCLLWSAQNGRYQKISGAVENSDLSDAVRSVARASLMLISREDTEYDKEQHGSMLAVLVSSEVLEESDQTALNELTVLTRSRAKELFRSSVTEAEIVFAKKLGGN